MTRYRIRTVRRIEGCLREHKGLTIRWLSEYLGMDERVVRNYLKSHPGVFEVKGKEGRSNLWGLTGDKR